MLAVCEPTAVVRGETSDAEDESEAATAGYVDSAIRRGDGADEDGRGAVLLVERVGMIVLIGEARMTGSQVSLVHRCGRAVDSLTHTAAMKPTREVN